MIKVLLSQTDNDSGTTVTEAVQWTKNLFKSNNKPFILKDTVDGPNTRVVFTEHFLMVLRDADSNECMAKMSKLEKFLYWDYLIFNDLLINIGLAQPLYTDEQLQQAALLEYSELKEYNTPDIVVVALTEYVTNEVLNIDTDNCYTEVHSWD